MHKSECPSTFIIGPDLPLASALDPTGAKAELTGWASMLGDLFTGKPPPWIIS